MTQRETGRLSKLEDKIDNLPDLIIERLDDRYLKKDDAPKEYLTAQGSVGYTAMSPHGQMSNGVQTTKAVGIVMAVSGSTVTVQCPEGCTIPTSGGISTVSYAIADAPFGFPKQTAKWTIATLMKTQFVQSSPTANTWYNVGNGNITIPIGEWNVSYQVTGEALASSVAAGVYPTFYTTLSTGASSASDADWTTKTVTSDTNTIGAHVHRAKAISVPSATPYYLNFLGDSSNTSMIIAYTTGCPGIIEAKNAYL